MRVQTHICLSFQSLRKLSKRRQFKDEAFNGKNTIEDMYSKRVVQKDSADVDHTYSIKKAYGDASIFNTEADIKKAVNQKQNYKITDSETVSMFCWQHGTVKPLCKAYKSEE